MRSIFFAAALITLSFSAQSADQEIYSFSAKTSKPLANQSSAPTSTLVSRMQYIERLISLKSTAMDASKSLDERKGAVRGLMILDMPVAWNMTVTDLDDTLQTISIYVTTDAGAGNSLRVGY